MARWKVDLVQTVYESCTVYVEAETEERAEELALEHSVEIEWRFDEVNHREVISAQPTDAQILDVSDEAV